jgi:hypothetical protein
VSEQCLNIFNVNTILKQMAGKAVAAAMTGYMFFNTGFYGTFLEILIDTVLVSPPAVIGHKTATRGKTDR